MRMALSAEYGRYIITSVKEYQLLVSVLGTTPDNSRVLWNNPGENVTLSLILGSKIWIAMLVV